jgi:hypothetical protein
LGCGCSTVDLEWGAGGRGEDLANPPQPPPNHDTMFYTSICNSATTCNTPTCPTHILPHGPAWDNHPLLCSPTPPFLDKHRAQTLSTCPPRPNPTMQHPPTYPGEALAHSTSSISPFYPTSHHHMVKTNYITKNEEGCTPTPHTRTPVTK